MLLSVRARSPEMTVVVVPLMLAIFIMPLPLSDICSCMVTSACAAALASRPATQDASRWDRKTFAMRVILRFWFR